MVSNIANVGFDTVLKAVKSIKNCLENRRVDRDLNSLKRQITTIKDEIGNDKI
jgi:hypothetical protein